MTRSKVFGVRPLAWAALAVLAIGLASCGDRPRLPTGEGGHYKLGGPYEIDGRWYYPAYDPTYDRTGVASWYGDPFHGRDTANGERFDKGAISAAHTTLPLPSEVRVTNLENGRSLVVRVNDRGPFVDDRIIDLSEAAAEELGFHHRGLARVRVEFLQLADARGSPPRPGDGFGPRVADRRAIEPAAPRGAPAVRVETARAQQPTLEPVRPLGPSGSISPRVDAAFGADPEADGVDAIGALQRCERSQGFVVQIGAFRDVVAARRHAERAAAIGPVSIEPVRAAGADLTRVRIGPLENRAAAIDAMDRLGVMGYGEARIALTAC